MADVGPEVQETTQASRARCGATCGVGVRDEFVLR